MSALKGASVLVTGGAGFIGSHLVDRLLQETAVARVTVLDNLATGRHDNLKTWFGDHRFKFLGGDVRDEAALAEVMPSADIVFHLACLGVRHSIHNPMENHSVNAGGTLSVLGCAQNFGVQRFLHVSSSEVYGSALHAPMDEDHPTFPETVYGGGKLAGEAYARAYFRTYGLPTIIARPFNTYGPRSHYEGDRGEVIPRTIVRALNGHAPLVFGDGEQTRDFMHVRDTVRGLVDLAECRKAIGKTVNLGSGVEIPMNQLAREILKAADHPALQVQHLEARPGDVRRLLVDSSLMHSLTGFMAEIPFREGIRDLVNWFRTQDRSPREMLEQVEDINWLQEVGA